MNFTAIFWAGGKVVSAGQWWGRFKKWQKEKDARVAAKAGVILIALFLTTGASCRNDIADLVQYCREHPEECGGPKPTPVPPVPTPTPTDMPEPATPTPTAAPEPIATPTETPTPTGTPAPGGTAMCARAIAMNAHFLVGGGGCHAWTPTGDGRVKCVLDSTWRPICDTDHMDNWNNPDICGKCSHDPDYSVEAGAQHWGVSGAEDKGVNCVRDPHNLDAPCQVNSAQRVIVGPPGGEVRITICPANPVIAAATGTVLPIRGDGGCSRPPAWNLPGN